MSERPAASLPSQPRSSALGNLILLATAIVWGFTFAAQSAAMKHMGPLWFYSLRSLVGVAALLPLLLAQRGKRRAGARRAAFPSAAAALSPLERRQGRRRLLAGSLVCGCCMSIASILQQMGLLYTTVGKSSFITALYILFVPLFSMFLGKRPHLILLPCILISVAGFYLLCVRGDFSVNPGDMLTLGCAFVYSFHILSVDHFSVRVDPIQLSACQMLVAALISGAGALLREPGLTWDMLRPALPYILYAGILSSGLGYTMQIIGQSKTQPAIAALVMSLESVFGALGGWLFLRQAMTRREFLGAAAVFAAVLLAQLPDLLALRNLRIPRETKGEPS
ncbi:MAG: DMT family transporter [Oscillospiraceae bacterium]|jgi:drug/metabolite transporter (DMT)-like permease|nr:DMT family transporter [Oscillospiraceae bacterium]